MLKAIIVLIALFSLACADYNFKYTQDDKEMCPPPSEKDIMLAKVSIRKISNGFGLIYLLQLNITTGGPYTYSQSAHRFYGTAYGDNY